VLLIGAQLAVSLGSQPANFVFSVHVLSSLFPTRIVKKGNEALLG
jgi:hypothetical protein